MQTRQQHGGRMQQSPALQRQPRRLASPGLHRRLAVCAAKQGRSSPWSTGSSGGSSNKGGGGSSTGKKSGSGSGSSSSSSKPKKAASKAPSGQGFGPKASSPAAAPLYKLTPPLTPQLLDELSPWQVGPSPAWTTFVGHCEGEWLGQYSAFTPWGGDPEPVWADEGGAYLLHAYSRASEARQLVPAAPDSDDEDAGPQQQRQQGQEQLADMLVRSTLRSSSISSLIGGMSAAAAAADGGSGGEAAAAAGAGGDVPAASPTAAADDEREGIAYNQGGSVVFTGGSYSVGPEYAAAPGVDASEWRAALDAADGDEGAAVSSLPFATVVVEQALVASGNDRLRLVATLKLRQPPGQEVDVEVARLLLYREHWYGTAESTGAMATPAAAAAAGGAGGGRRVLQLVAAHRFDVPIVDVARPQPAGLAGCWNVFVTAAAPMVEENPDTLQEEEVFVYSSREERQQWHVPGLTSSAALGSASAGSSPVASPSQLEDDGSGGSFWLPGGAVATLRMVSPPGGASSSSSNGNGSSGGRGLQVGLHWLAEPGSCLFVERQYGPDGELAEVRQGSAVKGGWSGGRM